MSEKKRVSKIAAVAILAAAVGVTVFLLVLGNRKPEYIFVMGDVGSHEDYPLFQSFEEEISRAGGIPKTIEIGSGENPSITQSQKLADEVGANTVCIVVNAASNSNLGGLLAKYRERGIKVISCISEVSSSYRDLHLGTVDTAVAGPQLMEEAAALMSREGQFAVVSGPAHSVLMSTLIQEIRGCYESGEYPDMTLTDILFGNEDTDDGEAMVKEFLEGAPETKTLLCLTEAMTESACAAVSELGMKDSVAIVGLGDPSYLETYMEDGELRLELFYCDFEEFGTRMALLAEKMVSGEITGASGETVELEGETYRIEDDVDGMAGEAEGSEIYLYANYTRYQSKGFEE